MQVFAQIRKVDEAKRLVFGRAAAEEVDRSGEIMDYLSTRFKGPVIIAESSAGDTMQGFENFKYNRVASEFTANPASRTSCPGTGPIVARSSKS